MVFINVIVPVIIIAGAGYAFARHTKLDPTVLARLSFYILTPALIFDTMLNRSISMSDFATTALFAVILHSVLTLISSLALRTTGWDADTRTSATLSFSLNNCGNYGLPILLFAFGDAGFALGVIYMVVHMLYQVVVGIGVASWRHGMSLGDVGKAILRVPWLYASIIAVALKLLSVELPLAVARPIGLVAASAIPVQLILLGMSLTRVHVGNLLHQALPISVAKLLIPPVLAIGLTSLLGIEGLLRAVLIIEASTPTAVNALILSLQYRRRSDLTAAIILLTTLGGLVTTTLLLWWLG